MNFDLTLNQNMPRDAKFLNFISSSFMQSSCLFSACELFLFDRLEENSGVLNDISRDLDIEPRFVERMLTLMQSMGLVTRELDGTYRNLSHTQQLLLSKSEDSILPVIEHYRVHVYSLFPHLTQALRDGKPKTHTWDFLEDHNGSEMYSEMTHVPHEFENFLKAMNIFSRGVGYELASYIDSASPLRVADLGGAGAQIATELLEKRPEVAIDIYDLAPAIKFGKDKVASVPSATESITFKTQDITVPFETSAQYDHVIISAVLGDWDKAHQDAILKNAYNMLKPSGTLIVSETLLDDDGSGPTLPALLSLYVLLLTQGGDNFSSVTLSECLVRNGFEVTQVVSNRSKQMRDSVIAVKAE